MKRLWPQRTRTRLITLLALWLLVGRTAFAQNEPSSISTTTRTDTTTNMAYNNLDDTAAGTNGGTGVSDVTDNVSNNTNNNEPCIAPLKYRATNGKPLTTCDENNCCLTCPLINNFYKEGVMDRLYRIFGSLGIVGFFLMTFLAITFVTLPGVRDNPTTRKLLLPFVISVCIFLFQNFFTVQQQRSQCVNEFEQATASHVMCGVQAVFTLAGAYSISCWSALLIIHLHLLSVWRSNFVLRHIGFFHVVIWLVTLAAAVIPLSLNKVESGNICFISQSASNLFYVPLSFIYVVFIVHLVTFAYMLNVSIRANFGGRRSTASHRTSMSETHRRITHVRHIFRLQWRALLGCVLMLIIYIVDIVFYVFYYQPPPDSFTDTYVIDWFECLKAGGSQNECSTRAEGVLPSTAFVTTFLFVNFCAGIMIFLIFAAKRRFVAEWINLMRYRRKPNGSHSASRATFMTDGTGRESRSEKPNHNPATRSIVTQGELDVTEAPRKPSLAFASYNHDNDGGAIEEASAYLPPPPRIALPSGDRSRYRDNGEGGAGYGIRVGLVGTTSLQENLSLPQESPSSPQGNLTPPPSPTNRKVQSYTRASSVLMPLTPNLRSSFGTETTEMSSSKDSPSPTAPPSPSRPPFDVEDPPQIKMSSPPSPPPIQTNISMARASFGVLDTPSPTAGPRVSFVDSTMPPPPSNCAMLANDDSTAYVLRSSEGDDRELNNEHIDDGEVFGRRLSGNEHDDTSERLARVSAFGGGGENGPAHNINIPMPVPSQEHPGDRGTVGVAVDAQTTVDKGAPPQDDWDLKLEEKKWTAKQREEEGDIEYGIAM